MKWYEDLPPDCPPMEVSAPNGTYFRLDEKNGLILQTGNDTHHFSWWRSTDFDLSTIKILEQ
ncbi:MAG: hypothetical protein ACOYPR_07585 [Saprospiraceae bacterium]